MRKFLIILIIALSLSFVLFKEGDRTQERVLPQEQALYNPLINSGYIEQAPYNSKLYTGQALLNTTLGLPDAKYEVLVPQGSTVYDLMDRASKQYGFPFSGKSFPGIGFFVEEIKGVKQNSRKGLYWIYSINGQVAQVGVSNYILKPHDVITWNYENEE